MSKAIFLGSFNPPHKGHYNCIKSVIDSGELEYLGIDKIHVIPCKQNPNKSKFHTSFVARYKMCEALFRDLIVDGKVVIDDIENEITPEYTYELINFFNSGCDKMIGQGFWWIITVETLQELFDGKWKHSEELLHNNFIIVYDAYDCLYNIMELVKKHEMCAIPIKLKNRVNYHSTELRQKIKDGQSISDETNTEINEFIKDNKIYID